jgi:PPOX class probable F420-dependent enzyme
VLNAAARAALTAGRVAHLVTINPNGSPQVSAVWVGLDGDEVVFGHLGGGHKERNIQRDERVALSVEAEGASNIGMANCLVIHGRARLVAGGAPQLLQRLAEVYLGPGIPFPPMPNPPPGYVVHIAVDRISGIGPWYE